MTRDEWIVRYHDIWGYRLLRSEPCPEEFCRIQKKIPELQFFEKGAVLNSTITRYHLFDEIGNRFQIVFNSSLDEQILQGWWIEEKLSGELGYFTIKEDVFLEKMKNGNEILRTAKNIEIDSKKNRLDFLLA